jgi:hypothetical protein
VLRQVAAGPCVGDCGARAVERQLEPPLWTIFTDPSTSCAGRGPRTRGPARGWQAAQQSRPELPVVRLRSRSDVRRWLDGPLREVVEPSARVGRAVHHRREGRDAAQGRAGLIGAALAFARSPQGQRMLMEARRRYDTPENRAKLRQASRGRAAAAPALATAAPPVRQAFTRSRD